MAGVSRPSALPFTTRLHEGRLDRMAVWDPRDAAALRLLLSQFDLVGACMCFCRTKQFHEPLMTPRSAYGKLRRRTRADL